MNHFYSCVGAKPPSCHSGFAAGYDNIIHLFLIFNHLTSLILVSIMLAAIREANSSHSISHCQPLPTEDSHPWAS